MSLSRRASVEAQRMMREAFMDLERAITVADRAQLKDLTLDDVRQAALHIEQQLAASQSLRNMQRLAPLFAGLGHYSQAIEILCNGTPYLPWIWAPIKLVLKISADYIEAFEQIIKVYRRLAEPLARFSLLQRPFSNNLEVQKALAIYYSDILKFHAEAYKFVRRNAWQRLFATSWGRFQRRFDNIFADLKAHEKLVDKIVNAAHISEAKDMREKLDDWRQQEMSKFKKQEEDRTSTEFHAILSVLRVDETHQIKVIDNLTAEANHHSGSCGWILQQPKVKAWARSGRDTQSVVLHGCVGSGKSVLAAQIGTFLRSSEHSLVAAHFCTYLYPESTDYNFIMQSLMVQIIRHDPELIALTYDWLVLKKKTPNCAIIEQLLRLLVEALGTSPSQQNTLHIVFDGLDECDDSTVSSVVKTLDKLIATAASSGAIILKVLLCTQMTPAVAKAVKRKRQISLSNEGVHLNRAIQDYTLQRINAIRPNLSQLRITDEDVTKLASQITKKADGMFLWAKLVMEFISKNLFYSREEILEAATKLPRELSKFYGRILSQIMANFDERSVQRISSVLSWVSFAKRPLRSPELLSALAFDIGYEQVNELVPAYILDRCEPLIQKQADSSYAFLHASVRDFLQSSDSALSITENHSQRQHGLATVHCLLSCQQIFVPSYPEVERVARILRGTHGFHMYATQFWVNYLLENLDLDQGRFFESELFVLSCRLAEVFIGARPSLEEVVNGELDTRLALIRQRHYPLYTMMKRVISEQNKDTLEDGPGDDINDDTVACDLIALKERYQAVIRRLLDSSNYTGITFQELEQFKQDFRTSAFTCRLWSCPHAVVGFSSIDCLSQHEKDHVKHVCRFPGCQYPVFSSARMLKDHVAKYHANSERRVVRDTIRRYPRRSSPYPRESPSPNIGGVYPRLQSSEPPSPHTPYTKAVYPHHSGSTSPPLDIPRAMMVPIASDPVLVAYLANHHHSALGASLGLPDDAYFHSTSDEKEASHGPSPQSMQVISSPRRVPRLQEVLSFSQPAYSHTDTSKQVVGHHDFDAPPPDNQRNHLTAIGTSSQHASGSLTPSHENEASLPWSPPPLMQGPLRSIPGRPELPTLASMSQGPSLDPPPPLALRQFGLSENSFRLDNAAVTPIRLEADDASSGMVTTRHPLPQQSHQSVGIGSNRPTVPYGCQILVEDLKRLYPNVMFDSDMVLETSSTPATNNGIQSEKTSTWHPYLKCLECCFSLSYFSDNVKEVFKEHLATELGRNGKSLPWPGY